MNKKSSITEGLYYLNHINDVREQFRRILLARLTTDERHAIGIVNEAVRVAMLASEELFAVVGISITNTPVVCTYLGSHGWKYEVNESPVYGERLITIYLF